MKLRIEQYAVDRTQKSTYEYLSDGYYTVMNIKHMNWTKFWKLTNVKGGEMYTVLKKWPKVNCAIFPTI